MHEELVRSVASVLLQYRGTSLIRNTICLGSYRRSMPGALWWSGGGGGYFLWARYPCTHSTVYTQQRVLTAPCAVCTGCLQYSNSQAKSGLGRAGPARRVGTVAADSMGKFSEIERNVTGL